MSELEDRRRFAAGYPGCLIIGGLLALVLMGGAVFGLYSGEVPRVVWAPQLGIGALLLYLCTWRKSLSIELAGRTVHRSGPLLLARTRAVPTERITSVKRVTTTAVSGGGQRRLGRADVSLVIDDEAPLVVPGLVTTEQALDLALWLRVPCESWDDGRLKERRDATGRLVTDGPPASP